MKTIKIYMKAVVYLVVLGFFAVSASAQVYDMKIWKNGVVTHPIPTANIDSVTFEVSKIPADGVLINGIVWAKCNVDAPGTFAATPEARGMIYQWNRPVAWDALSAVSGWDPTPPEGDSWTEANDPSPEGWRIPTGDELESLLDVTKVTSIWTNQNDKDGYLFTDIASGNTLFLPTCGYRGTSAGGLDQSNSNGYYWSSTTNGDNLQPYRLRFNSGLIEFATRAGNYGQSVRSILKDYPFYTWEDRSAWTWTSTGTRNENNDDFGNAIDGGERGLFDGTLSSGWAWFPPAGNLAGGVWYLTVDMHSVKAIKAIKILSLCNNKTISVSVSSNNTNWQTVGTLNSTQDCGSEELLVELQNPTAARYIKLTFLQQIWPGGYNNIGEIDVLTQQ
jgi:uncharacterized protein (TIGR02145 family)